MIERSKQLNLEQYESDKISNRYLDTYDSIFEPFVDKDIVLLELGVYRGGSLLLWRDYFTKGTIVGIDLKKPWNFPQTERVSIYQGDQSDTKFLTSAANTAAPGGFDIIIDDASHIGSWTKISFWHLFENHLKPGGIFAIEDWGTGYWDEWPDGKSLDLDKYQSGFPESWLHVNLMRFAMKLGLKIPWQNHSYGMVGLLKQLIDEQAASTVTRKRQTGRAPRGSKFESMKITPAIVFIQKAKN